MQETNEDDGDVSAFLEFSAAMDRATNDWELVQVAKRWMKAKMVRSQPRNRSVPSLASDSAESVLNSTKLNGS